MSKYSPLTYHLQTRRQAEVPMHFSDIEAILGFDLPPSSRQHRAWWSNNPSNNVMTKAWLAAGYHTRSVDIAAERLVFEKLNTIESVSSVGVFSEAKAKSENAAASGPQPRSGDHPLWGALAGMITLSSDLDLTAPMFSDAELDGWMDHKSALIRGGKS